jgi:hypothetical protein
MKMIIAALAIFMLISASAPVHGDMGILDDYRYQNWRSYMAGMPGVSGPGVVVSNVPMSDDQEFLQSVQDVLDEYAYNKKYKLENFDCTNSSQITWSVLKENGFDARLMYCNEIAIGRKDRDARDFYGHVWVVVPRNKYSGGSYQEYVYRKSGGWISVETTENYTRHLGLASETARPYGWFRPNEGWLFNSSLEYSLLTGDYYEPEDVDQEIHEAG